MSADSCIYINKFRIQNRSQKQFVLDAFREIEDTITTVNSKHLLKPLIEKLKDSKNFRFYFYKSPNTWKGWELCIKDLTTNNDENNYTLDFNQKNMVDFKAALEKDKTKVEKWDNEPVDFTRSYYWQFTDVINKNLSTSGTKEALKERLKQLTNAITQVKEELEQCQTNLY